MDGNGAAGLLAVVAAATSFLVIETVLFHGRAYLNHPADEIWLRHTLGPGPSTSPRPACWSSPGSPRRS